MKLKNILLFVLCMFGMRTVLLPHTDGGSLQAKQAKADRPNVVLIIVDDVGYGQLSSYPHMQPVRTPNMDALAASGIRMTQGYSADPMCAPTRKALRSGHYWQRYTRGDDERGQDMIGQYFKDAGYATAAIGKSQFPNNPVDHGFDEFFGFRAGLHDNWESRIPDMEAYRTANQMVARVFQGGMGQGGVRYRLQRYSPILENKKPVEEFDYLTTEFTSRAVDFVKRNKERPFFMYLSYNAVHHPFQAPEEYLKRRETREGTEAAQLAQLDCLDDEIGRLINHLESLNLRKNTLIVLVSDNGGLRKFDGTNWKLREGKGSLYEGGIRVPFIASWPGTLPSGKVYEQPVMHMDIVPTLTAAAGISTEKGLFDGVNLLPYWQGQKSAFPHERLFWGLRSGGVAVREGDWKLVRPFGSDKLELYNLAEDLSESNDLSANHPKKKKALEGKIHQWEQEMSNQ